MSCGEKHFGLISCLIQPTMEEDNEKGPELLAVYVNGWKLIKLISLEEEISTSWIRSQADGIGQICLGQTKKIRVQQTLPSLWMGRFHVLSPELPLDTFSEVTDKARYYIKVVKSVSERIHQHSTCSQLGNLHAKLKLAQLFLDFWPRNPCPVCEYGRDHHRTPEGRPMAEGPIAEQLGLWHKWAKSSHLKQK